VFSRDASRLRKKCSHGLAVTDQGPGKGIAARRRLRTPGQDCRLGDPFAGGVGLESHVAGVEVSPPSLVGPEHDASVDADRLKPGSEVVTDHHRFLAVGGQTNDGDAGAGFGVAAVGVADGTPDDLAVMGSGGQVDASHREFGAHRQEDDRLFGLESEHVRDDRDQLVRGTD